ncbi:MAG: hypothetical protein ACK50A_12975 [Sphingobacteriaceae bacterium]
MNFDLKKLAPYILGIVLFSVLTLAFFRPLLSGKELKQGDIDRHKGMSKEIADFREKHNDEPLWTNSMFGGMPAYQISTLYPGNWLTHLDAAFKLFMPHPSGYLFLYFLGFFILLLCLKIEPWLAVVGAIAYGLSSYFLIIIEAGHNSKANALGYLPALLGGIILLFNGRTWLGFALTALFTAMELNANHVQISYYGYILIGFVVLGYFINAITSKNFKTFGLALALFIVSTVLGVLPNAGNLMCTNEYVKMSTRGKTDLTINEKLEKNSNNVTSGLDKDYATQWSYGIGETFTFLIPDFKGGPSNSIQRADANALKKVNPEFKEQVASMSSYFGDQPFTSGPVYIGAIIMFLAFLGMFIVKDKLKWSLFAATVLTIALSWGSNYKGLTDFFMDHVPGYNKFRAVSMILVVAELTIPLLAIMAVNELIKHKNWSEKIVMRIYPKGLELKKILTISFIVVGGFCLLCYIAPGMFNTFTASNEEAILVNEFVKGGNPEAQVKPFVAQMMPELEKAREAIFKADAIRSFIFILLAVGFIYLYYTNKIKKEILLAALGVFILIDLWTVDTRYLDEKSFVPKSQNIQDLTQKTSADDAILADKSLNKRVLNLTVNTFNDASTSYYHQSIGGYHGAKLKKYQELIDFHITKEINTFYSGANKALGNDSLMDVLLSKLNVINMLNTKYFILPGGEGGKAAMPFENKQSNGNAWFVKKVKTVSSSDDEIVELYKVNTKSEVVIQDKFKKDVNFKESYDGAGSIKLTAYEPNHLVYQSETASEELAVFSEIYYPYGWNAYVDGQLKPHAAANYVLRSLLIPAGKHTVEFKFEPKTYQTGNSIAMIGSALLFLSVGLGIYLELKGKKVVN